MSDDRAELLAAIKAKAVVRGDFVLSSGQRADFYVDLRRVLLDGRLAPLAGRVMLDLTGQRRQPPVEQDPAQIHVEVGALP